MAAVYSEDKKWYRSQVLKVEGDTCSLFFVDYGNEEDQTVQNVKEIRNQKIKDIPAQTLACCLHGLDTFPPAVTQDDLAAVRICSLFLCIFILEVSQHHPILLCSS